MVPETRRSPIAALAAVAMRRLAQAALVALVVSTVVFFLMLVLPGDLAFRIAAARYGYDLVTGEAADAVRAELGLDGSRGAAFLAWLVDVVQLDLGVSLVSGAPVIREIGHELGATMLLAVASLGIAAPIGVALGIAAGLRPGGVLDRATLAAGVLLRAVPAFVSGLLLILLFSVELRALPAAGDAERTSLVLPAVTLALGLAPLLARVTRDAIAAVVASPQFLFARTKGLSDRQALQRHGLRNAAVPVVAYLGVQFAVLVEGVVIVETIFAWPGLGHSLVHAIFGRDLPMVQGAALALGFLFVVFNALVDVACMALDPRRRAA